MSSRLDRVLFWLCILGLMLLCFGVGSAFVYLKLPPYQWIDEAMEARDALKAQEQVIKQLMRREISLHKGKTVRINTKQALQGYTLFNANPQSAAFLIDMEGNEVHRWQRPYSQSFTVDPDKAAILDKLVYWVHANVYPNGDLLVSLQGKGHTPYGFGLVKLDKDSNLLWSYGEHLHHYIDIAPDGTIYGLTQAMFPSANYPGLSVESKYVLEDFVVILTPDGKETHRIPLIDALAQSDYKSLLDIPDQTYDVVHANSVVVLTEKMAKAFPMFEAGQMLVSLRSINAIGVLDPDTKKFVWATRGPWRMQHDAEFVEDGTIMLFDNQGSKRKHTSRIIKYHPGTADFEVVFKGGDALPFSSLFSGRQQALPNGNLLITESVKGRIMELNRKNELVWEFITPHRVNARKSIINHAQRYTPEQVKFLQSESR